MDSTRLYRQLLVENYSKTETFSLPKSSVMQEVWKSMTAYSAGVVVTEDIFMRAFPLFQFDVRTCW